MSSTARGAVRHADDFYETPAWCTRAILPHLIPVGDLVLEPACGNGAILRVLREVAPAARLHGIELDGERGEAAAQTVPAAWIEHGDFLQSTAAFGVVGGAPFDLCITNPPFALAMPFVLRALERASTVAMLLRLNWLGSQGRAHFHRGRPSDVYVLPRRPSFTDDGKTDSCDYAWFVWGAGRGGRWRILDCEAA